MSSTLSQNTIQRVNRWKLAGLLSLLISGFVILLTVENLLVSALLAFVISYTLGPLVNFLERKGVERTLATAGTFLVIGAILILAGFGLFPYFGKTLSGLQEDMPRFISGVGRF